MGAGMQVEEAVRPRCTRDFPYPYRRAAGCSARLGVRGTGTSIGWGFPVIAFFTRRFARAIPVTLHQGRGTAGPSADFRRIRVKMGRRAHFDIPLSQDATGRFLPWIIALMVYLAVLALAASLILSGLARRWDSELSSGMTVQVAPTGPNGARDQEERVRKVMDALSGSVFVADARRLSDADARALVEPWLGDGALVAELPLPALIDVRLADGANIDDLTEQLNRAAAGVTVEDPARWLGDLRRLARTVQALAVGIIALIGGAGVASIIFAASAGFAVHKDEVELLHVMGATDGYVAGQFQSHMMRQSLLGGGIGFLLALATLWGLQQAGRGLDASLLPDMALNLRDWAWLPAVPVTAVILAAATARLTVMRALGRLP